MNGRSFAVITQDAFSERIALVDDESIDVAFKLKEDDDRLNLFDVVLGKITRNVPALQGAFVDIGKETAFLSYRTKEQLAEGSFGVFQVIQESYAQKEAKLTTNLTVFGVYLNYFPFSTNSIKTEEQSLLEKRGIIQANTDGAWLVKSTAKNASNDSLITEISSLKNVFAIIENAKQERRLGVLYSFGNKFDHLKRRLPLYDTVYTNDPALLNNLEIDYKPLSPKNIAIIEELDKEIFTSLSPNVPLKCGAELVFDECEACTVIDVNSGSSLDGTKDNNILKVNIQAAKEIAKQLKMRNIGGSVLIDFITPKTAQTKKAVVDALSKSIVNDDVKVYDFTRLGFVELTRKRGYTQKIDPDIIQVWKLRKDLSRLPLTVKSVQIKYPTSLEPIVKRINQNDWFSDIKISIDCIPSPTDSFAIQII